ncbi:MAG: hypothetical protein U0746_17040 [Gemmataceae bacterium]
MVGTLHPIGPARRRRVNRVALNQPVAARGETKRLLELSVAEAGPAFVAAGLIAADELDRTVDEMRRLAADETVVAVMPRMTQVWARKPARCESAV